MGDGAPREQEEEGEPPGGQHLDLTAVGGEAERSEAIEEGAQERGSGLARERERERVERERIERRCGEGDEVVNQDGVRGGETQWDEQDGEPEEVVRVEEGARVRVEDVRVEHARGIGGERVLVPGEGPDVQQTVVTGRQLLEEHVVAEPGDEPTLATHGERGEQQRRAEVPRPASPRAFGRGRAHRRREQHPRRTSACSRQPSRAGSCRATPRPRRPH